jgi:phospholipase D1/2
LDGWSGGLTQTEKSILNAYIMLIEKAEHYIYIENQFFVTTTNPIKDEVKNTIGDALVKRIKRAHDEKKAFKVYVFLPLFPAFDSQNAIQAVQYYNLRSIKFGEFSIYKELARAGVATPSDYITFHGMRNWTVLTGNLIQEIIYIHSKLMIVDDTFVICGSANINDRSMLGTRDSELACLVKDEEFELAEMNGKFVKVGKYASSLRKKLFKLHLGIYYSNPNKISVMDCASDKFFKFFKEVSAQNSKIYEDCFKCLPSNEARTFPLMHGYVGEPKLAKTDPHRAKKLLEEHVSGFVVDFPLEFMSEESSFFPSINTKEGLVPAIVWT